MGEIFIVDAMGYKVGKSGMKIVVSFSDGTRIERSVLTFSSLILGGSGSISLNALKLLADYNIPVVLTGSHGAFATFHPFFMHGTVIVRREQFLAYLDNRGVVLAKGFVLGALLNKVMVLRYFAKNRNDSLAVLLLNHADSIERIADEVRNIQGNRVDDIRLNLMGLEGEGSRLYYEALSRIIPKELGFESRNRRPPRDPVNAALSYGYIMLNSVVALTIAKVGLEPFAGFLHVDRSGKPSLVLDLSEEFRQSIIDIMIVSMFSRGWLNQNDFDFTGSSVLLNKEGKRKFFEHFRKRLKHKVRVNGVNTTLEGAILRQAREIVRFLLGRSNNYESFVFRWW